MTGRSSFKNRFRFRPEAVVLEPRRLLTGNIAVISATVVNQNNAPLAAVAAGQEVYIQVSFTTQDLPSNASYSIDYTVNGLTSGTAAINLGAGIPGTGLWHYRSFAFIASPGTNQVTVTVNPDQTVPETTYADNTTNFAFGALASPAGALSYTVAQIRTAYGINLIPNYRGTTADGSGETIALVDSYNAPNIITDLDGFDQAMHLSSNSSPTLYQQYGPASSILSVYNVRGQNITADIADSGNASKGVPPVDPNGQWELEETVDVEWAHAIAPGAKIDLIETGGKAPYGGGFWGARTAARLPGVSVVSMSWGFQEQSQIRRRLELHRNSTTFVTPRRHIGVTFVAAAGDSGSPGGYPALSRNVVGTGGTQLLVNGDTYASETGWSFPTPRTLEHGSDSYSQTGSWTSQSGGYSGTYSSAPARTDSSASWTTAIAASDQGHEARTEVSASWTARPGAARNARFKIYVGNATTGKLLRAVTVNQAKAPVGTSTQGTHFQDLGVFQFPLGGTVTVVLSAKSAGGTVVADAVGIAPALASGGGPSRYQGEPQYQRRYQATGYRTSPDVSFDASDQSGVTFYLNGALSYHFYGTSLASPCWAGLLAIGNQGRVANGGKPFNSVKNPRQTLQALYSLPARDFHHINTGYNGQSAKAGYDQVTGRGSPIANLLVPALAKYGLRNFSNHTQPRSGDIAERGVETPGVGGSHPLSPETRYSEIISSRAAATS